jgi:hypothetical protein
MTTDADLSTADAGYSFTPAERSAWSAVLSRFRTAADDVDAAVADLRRTAPIVARSPVLAREHSELMARANRLHAMLGTLRSAIADVKAALLGVWTDVRGIWSRIAGTFTLGEPPTLQGIPLIPIAAVTAATAALTAFLVDYGKFSRRVALYTAEIGRGRSPQEATAIVERVAPSRALITIGGIPIWLIALAGIAGWWFFTQRRGR